MACGNPLKEAQRNFEMEMEGTIKIFEKSFSSLPPSIKINLDHGIDNYYVQYTIYDERG